MSKVTSNCITDEHLILFGALIQWFAQPEVLMQKIMATISGADVTSVNFNSGDYVKTIAALVSAHEISR